MQQPNRNNSHKNFAVSIFSSYSCGSTTDIYIYYMYNTRAPCKRTRARARSVKFRQERKKAFARSRSDLTQSSRFSRIAVLPPPLDQRGRTRRKLWIASPMVRPSAIGNIRRRMCSLPKPWPTWPASDSAWPACAASESAGTACPAPRGVLRP